MGRFYDIIRVIVAVVCLGLYTAGFVFYGKTIIVWWYPVAAAMAVACVTAPLFYDKWGIVTKSSGKWLNALCHMYIIGSIAYFAFLGGNYILADTTTGHKEHATVAAKQKKTHKKYRTVGRRRRIPNGTYDTFSLYLEFENGTKKEISVTRSTYNKSRTGSTRTLYMQKGLLGFPVIKK